MKQLTNLRRKSTLLLLTLVALFAGGVSPAWGDELTIYSDADYSSDYVPFDGYDADAVQHDQMIIPSTVLTSLNGKKITSMKFYYKKNETSGTNVGNWIVSLGSTEATTLSNLDNTTSLTQVFSGAITPDTETKTITITFDDGYVYNGGNLLVDFNHPTASGYKKFTFWCSYITPAPAYSKGATRTYLPKTTFTYEDAAASEGPALTVKDGLTKLSSPYTYSFGLTTAGTTKVFTLSNPGTEACPVSVAHTGSFGAELSVNSIPAGGEVTLTVTMPASSGDDVITISSTDDGIDDFIINVTGVVRDPNKVYLDFSDGQIPDGWTSVQVSSYGSAWAASEGYVSQSGSSSSYAWAFTSPKLDFENGETICFETEKYSSSAWYTPSVTVEYTTDATGTTGWTTIGSAFTDDTYDSWKKRSVTIPVEGVKRIRFNGWYIKLTNIYGGELPNEPKMVVTQPATLDFGLYDKDASPAPTKTFTIANTGLATLNGISVTSGNAAFTITNAPTSLAAGESQEVTITMATATTGALSSLITVSATEMEPATFTVTGCVKPAGMPVEDFTDGLPANWTNASWTFADGKASGKSSSAYLTTPKLTFNAGDLLIIRMAPNDTYSGDYLTIQGSNDNGSTFTAYSKKIEVPQGKDIFANYVVSDIPTTINKIRFVGYYVDVDEIYGLTYAPQLSVTTGDPAQAVTTPAAYDFGETTANASVTYNFANSGSGTINISNVAITGEGAAAYSTNWTETIAAPFDLVITRTYDAGRGGAAAMEAVVTVTTSEGDFVINVTGTDKGANDPEFAILIGEAEQTTGANLGFGTITANTVKTFKIKNDGTGALNVTAITMPDADYTTDLESEPSAQSPLVIAAGGSKTINVTLAASAKTIKSSKNITISAEGFEDFTFVADANVFPGAEVIDFNGNSLPDGWTNSASNKWSFAEGKAYCTAQNSSPAELVTKKLVFEEDDFFTFSATSYDNYDNNFLEILGSTDNGETWEAFDAKKFISKSQIPYGSYATITVTGIPNTVNKLKFRGYYVRIDEIAGITYDTNDPTIAVKDTEDADVASGTTKDFGWSQTAQSTTYKISNSGTGTLTISEITAPDGFTAATAGDAMTVAAGADPLVLTVTMSNAAIGAKSGTVTLTTDGGNFEIPVKGFIYGDRNLVDFTDAAQYQGWTGVNVTDNAAKLSSTAIETTPFAATVGEELYVEIKGNSSYTTHSFSYSYSRDGGANWSDATTLVASTYSAVPDQVFTITDIADAEAASNVMIRFTGAGLSINRIYGFEALTVPVMTLDKTADYNFNMQTANEDYVITVTNTGTATLTNLAAALATGTNYTVTITKPEGESTTTISEGKATVPAGQQAVITVTQVFDANNGLASLSDVLTISADDVTSKVINLSGQTRDGSKWYVDFSTNSPEGILSSTGWTLSSYYGYASATTESALVSQTLTIAANEKVQFDAKQMTYGTPSLKVRHSLNGGLSWSDYTDFTDTEDFNSSAFKTMEYSVGNSDASAVAMIEFLGANVYLDNIYGGTLNNDAPMIQVKKYVSSYNQPVVASGVTHEFSSISTATDATYTITNIGNGTLTITDPVAATGGATTSISATSLTNGQSATLTITMAPAEPYGEKSGAVTVETNLGNFVINYTATTMNPNALDFSDGNFPAGWYNGGWSTYSGYIYRNYPNNNPVEFVSQKLTVAGTDDKLTFDAEKYGSSYASNTVLEVYYSTDRVNWTLIKDYAEDMTTNWQTFEIKDLEAGDYYLKFNGRYAEVDNIKGWTKAAAPTRDLYVATFTTPSTTKDAGDEVTISATVASLIDAQDGVYAKLFVDGEQVGDASTAKNIALNGTQTFSFDYNMPAAGTHTAQIKVYYSDNDVAFTTAEKDMKVYYVFDETVASTFTAGISDVKLTYTKAAGSLGTICLPFTTTTEVLSGLYETTVKVYEMYSFADNVITFTGVDELTAGTPYLIYSDEAMSGTKTFADMVVTAADAGTTEASSVTFHGLYAPVTAGNWGSDWYGVTSAGNIAPGNTETTTMKALRGYFTGNVAGARVMILDDDATGIDNISNKMADGTDSIYNLSGQKVNKAQKGLYIINGKKVFVK